MLAAIPTILIDDVRLVEGDTGTPAFVFAVTRSGDLSQASTVNCAMADGTATTSDSDYVAKSGELLFGIDEDVKTITVNVTGDTIREGDEIFYVDLLNPGNATITDSRGAGTIVGDDGVDPPPGLVSWWTADSATLCHTTPQDAFCEQFRF